MSVSADTPAQMLILDAEKLLVSWGGATPDFPSWIRWQQGRDLSNGAQCLRHRYPYAGHGNTAIAPTSRYCTGSHPHEASDSGGAQQGARVGLQLDPLHYVSTALGTSAVSGTGRRHPQRLSSSGLTVASCPRGWFTCRYWLRANGCLIRTHITIAVNIVVITKYSYEYPQELLDMRSSW
jgi:hypothetical protein